MSLVKFVTPSRLGEGGWLGVGWWLGVGGWLGDRVGRYVTPKQAGCAWMAR